VWVLLTDGSDRLASFLKLAVLGRLLSPRAFGVVGVASLLLQWLAYFTQPGLDSALIQRRGGIKSYLDTVWTIHAIRGLGLALLLFVCAPAGAMFSTLRKRYL